jgi:hypothetical protein
MSVHKLYLPCIGESNRKHIKYLFGNKYERKIDSFQEKKKSTILKFDSGTIGCTTNFVVTVTIFTVR